MSDPAERSPRQPLSIPAHFARKDGSIHDVQVVDLSTGGCKIALGVTLWTDERLNFSIPGKGALPAIVRWVRDDRAGLQFDDAPELSKAEVERIEDRVYIGVEVSLRRVGRPDFRVTLLDISQSGCRIEVLERPNVGERLHLGFPGLNTPSGTVRWIDGFVVGLHFDQPFHPAVFDLLIQRLIG